MKLPRGARNESHLLFCWTLYFYATDRVTIRESLCFWKRMLASSRSVREIVFCTGLGVEKGTFPGFLRASYTVLCIRAIFSDISTGCTKCT